MPVDTKYSEHPLYVMLTIASKYGESSKRYWNGWVSEVLSPEQKDELIKEDRATAEDLQPLTAQEKQDIINALKTRCNSKNIRSKWPQDKQNIINALSGSRPIDNAPQKQLLNFVSTKIPHIYCNGFIFPMSVAFDKAEFVDPKSLSVANFRKAVFLREATFTEAKFAIRADFNEAVFSQGVSFRESEFSLSADFTKARFSLVADFRKTIFNSLSVFNNAKFESPTSFTEAKFHETPPIFYGATLHEDTDWRGIKWPDVPKEDIERAGQFRRAYECLRLIMAKQNKFQEEHLFQRLEFRCREAEEPSSLKFDWAAIKDVFLLAKKRSWKEDGEKISLPTIFSRFYGWSSDYGWSIGRPLIGLIAIWFFGSLLIWLFGGECIDFWESIDISLNNTIPLPGFNTDSYDDPTKLSGFLKIIKYLQSILGIIFLFLLGLGIRNRFRIK